MKEEKCIGCGKIILRTNREINAGLHKYCSQQCYFKNGCTKKRPIRMTGRYFNCVECGKRFYKPKVMIENGACKYCSQKCYKKSMNRIGFPNLDHTKYLKPIKCSWCGKEFNPTNSKIKYCSSECYHRADRTIPDKICPVCGKNFRTTRVEQVYCSSKCYNSIPKNNWNNWKKNVPMSEKLKKKIHKSNIDRYNKIGRKSKRNKHSLWRYNNWTKKVLKRDNFTCQDCGRRGGHLQAHHIKSWAKYPKERYWLKNGVTLCLECHWKRHPNMSRKMFGLK